jgi:DNA gyrase/topoisomerase IV subunit B
MANDKIVKLTEAGHARVRTEMYLGSRDPHSQVVLQYENGQPYAVEQSWIPAVFTAFREILDNSLDEVAGHGHGDRIDITYDPATMIFSVADNGRGIPIDFNEEHQVHAATLALSHARAGRNFGDRGQLRGTNGIGASVVNFCSEWFHLDIERDNQHFHQEFSEGPSLDSDLVVNTPVIKKKNTSKATGTLVTFKLSSQVFKDMTLPEDFLQARIYEVALCNPKIKIYYNGTKVTVKAGLEKNLFPGMKPIHIGVTEGSFTSDFWMVPHFFEDGEHQHSLVNSIPAFDGGVHMDTFKRYFFSGLLTALERESKKRKLQPNRSDLADGLLLYNITTMDAPNFNSQAKTRLNNEETSHHVKKALDDPDFFKNIIKKYGDWIDDVYARCAERTMKKDAADASKLAKKVLRSKVAGLMDASGTDRTKCILFLAEGLSAISGMASVRDPKIHAGLGLKGKVMNVHSAAIKDVLEDGALQDIMNAMGLIPGQKAKRENLRFGKIYVAHDMDPDGLNIGALLNNFFFTYWPELYDPKQEPVVHIFMTPFIIAEKGKQRKYWYSDNHMDFDPEQYKGWSITRAKGLGTLTEEDWAHSLAEPKLMALTDETGDMKETLDLIFNSKRANDRKDWIGL